MAATPKPQPSGLNPNTSKGRVSLELALQIAQERRGRPLTPQEQADVKAVVEGGASEQDLRTAPMGRGDESEGTFPTLYLAEGASRAIVASTPTASNGSWTPNQVGTSPASSDDPFGFGAWGTTEFGVQKPDYSDARFERTGFKDGAVVGGTAGVSKTVNDFVSEFVRWDPGKTSYWQDRLVAAGLLAKGGFVRGWADAATLKAISDAIQESQDRSMTLPDLLDNRADLITENPVEEGGTILAEHDLRGSIKDAFQRELGRAPTEDELEKYERVYRSLESRAQTAPDGEVVESAGSPASLVAEQIEMTPEANAVRVRKGIDSFFGMVGV